MRRLAHHHQFRVLDGIDSVRGGLAGEKTVEIGDGPSFQRKLKDMLPAAFIQAVFAQRTLFYKEDILAHITFLQQVLFPPHFFRNEVGLDNGTVLFRQRYLPVDMFEEYFVHRAKMRTYLFKKSIYCIFSIIKP